MKKRLTRGSHTSDASKSPAPAAVRPAPAAAAPVVVTASVDDATRPSTAIGEGQRGRSTGAAPQRPLVQGTPVDSDLQRALRDSMKDPQPLVPCRNGCGWTAFVGHQTCCSRCVGPGGPHSRDCSQKNMLLQPLCERGCGRAPFGSFHTCCTRCQGPDGPHTRDCAQKNDGGMPAGGLPDAAVPAKSGGPVAPAASKDEGDVEETVRTWLTEWREAGAMKTPTQVDNAIFTLAREALMDPQQVRMIWLKVARQARPTRAPVQVYTQLAKDHYGLDADVVDLGQFSAEHSNSCMFLCCAVSIADRYVRGFDDAKLPGVLGLAMDEAGLGSHNELLTVDELAQQHKETSLGTLGRMADALRDAACDVLACDEDFFLPFYHPVRRRRAPGAAEPSLEELYRAWVAKLRGDEEGDELVILALSRLCGMAVQPVQQSGYRVPLMDPTDAAKEANAWVVYWGNDDRHWVWLRPKET